MRGVGSNRKGNVGYVELGTGHIQAEPAERLTNQRETDSAVFVVRTSIVDKDAPLGELAVTGAFLESR